MICSEQNDFLRLFLEKSHLRFHGFSKWWSDWLIESLRDHEFENLPNISCDVYHSCYSWPRILRIWTRLLKFTHRQNHSCCFYFLDLVSKWRWDGSTIEKCANFENSPHWVAPILLQVLAVVPVLCNSSVGKLQKEVQWRKLHLKQIDFRSELSLS